MELVRSKTGETAFLPRAGVDGGSLIELMGMTQEEFSRRFKALPVKRIRDADQHGRRISVRADAVPLFNPDGSAAARWEPSSTSRTSCGGSTRAGCSPT